MPDRKPVKWNGTRSWIPFQYCHFSCHPTPSKLVTTNCGGSWPGLSLVGTKRSAWAPVGGFVPALDVVVVVDVDV